jgi:polyphosphate kinase
MSDNSVRFINRDLSWLDFNARVLAEGLRPDIPPLNRFRLMAIVSSNLDEFYMVRFAAMKRALRAGIGPDADPAGLGPETQIKTSAEKVRAIIGEQYTCLTRELFPALAEGGLELVRPDQYSIADMDFLESFFMRDIFPVLTPLRFDSEGNAKGNTFGNDGDAGLQAISNLSIHAAFLLEPEAGEAPVNDRKTDSDSNTINRDNTIDTRNTVDSDTAHDEAGHISIVRIPAALSRIIRLPPGAPEPEATSPRLRWALLDDLILIWGAWLFSGYTVRESLLFTINRYADFSVDEERDEDFVEAMEEVLVRRDSSRVMRMVLAGESRRLREDLARRFDLEAQEIFQAEGPLDLMTLMALFRGRTAVGPDKAGGRDAASSLSII